MNHPEFTIVTDSASAASVRKGFLVGDAMAKSSFCYKDAERMGFSCDTAAIKRVMDADPAYKAAIEAFAKDAGLSIGEANIDALGQFFTLFNEQTINVLYRGRTAKQTFGVKTMGDWTTERIAFKTRELTTPGPALYDDWTRAPYASYNYGWDTRDTLRVEWALEVTKLEEAVGSIMRRNPYIRRGLEQFDCFRDQIIEINRPIFSQRRLIRLEHPRRHLVFRRGKPIFRC